MARALTSSEVCRLLEISPKTLYEWERAGKIPRASRDRRGWRTYSTRQFEAVRQHARPVEPAPKRAGRRVESDELQGLTARNQLRGTVRSIASEGLLSEVVLQLKDGQEIVALVTRNSVKRLGLKRGQAATAVIKATEVMLFS